MSKNDLSSLTKKELLDLARDRDVAGRSKMDKDELVAALESSGKPRRTRAAAKAEPAPAAPKAARPRAAKAEATPSAKSSGTGRSRTAAKAEAPAPASGGAAAPRVDSAAASRESGVTAEPNRPAPAAEGNRRPQATESAATSAAPPVATNRTGDVEATAGPGAATAGDRPEGDRADGDRDQGRDGRGRRGRRRGRGRDRDDRNPGAGGGYEVDDSDPWNRIDGADPNYGRFLNPQTADFRRGGNRRGRPGTGNGNGSGPSRSGTEWKSGARTQDRAQQARDTMRRTGEARQGVSYTPAFERSSAGDDSRGGSNRSRRSRRREERRRRKAEGRTESTPQNARRQEAGGNRPSVDLPRVWKEDVARREDYHRAREGKGRDGRTDFRQEGPGRNRRDPRDSFGSRQDARGGRGPEDDGSFDAIGVIGPVDPNQVQGEIHSMRQKGDGRQGPAEPSKSRCRVLPRDPYWIHVFWELDEEHVFRTASALEVPFEDLRWVLRIHSLPAEVGGEGSQPPGFFDQEIGGDEQSTYVHVGIPDRDYRVDIGLLTDRGLFCPVASSNRVRTPKDTAERPADPDAGEVAAKFYEESGGSPAPRIDRTDAPVLQRDLEASRRPQGRSGRTSRDGDGAVEGSEDGGATALATGTAPAGVTATSPGAAPTGARGVAQPRPDAPVAKPTVTSPGALPVSAAQPTSPGARPTSPGAQPGWVTSPGARPTSPTRPISSPHARPAVQGPQPSADRGFWLAVQTELVVSGMTEPDAKVTIQGIPIPLRPDGTFTVRFELPDGEQVVPVIAVSKDGMFEKEITPRVTRETTKSERILGEVGADEARADADVDADVSAGTEAAPSADGDAEGTGEAEARGRSTKGRTTRRTTGGRGGRSKSRS
ncbi:MAG: DUF4912 domain-containing protein [Candidatus Eisenbacteria bacterium]